MYALHNSRLRRFALALCLAGALCRAQQQGPSPQATQNNSARNYPLGIAPDATPLYPELKRAYELGQTHKSDEAVAGFRAALAKAVATQDQRAQALAHEGLASIFNAKADYPAARSESEQALALLQRLQNPLGVAQVQQHLGNVSHHLGDDAIAREYYQQALRGFESLGMLHEKATVLENLVMAGAPEGDKLLEQALDIARKVGNRPLEAGILQSMGDLLFSVGQLDTAQEKYTQAIAILQQIGDNYTLAYVLTSEGRVQRAHGHPERAIPLYQKALELQRDGGDRYGTIQSTNALAVAYDALDDHNTAILLYEKALAMARETGSAKLLNFELGNLAGAYEKVGRIQESVAILEELLRKGTEQAEYRYGSLGTGYLRLGRLQESENAFSRAAEISRQNGNWDVLHSALAGRAEVEEKLGNQDAALADAQEALRVIEGVRTHLVPSDFMKRGFSEANRSDYGLYVHLLERAHQPGRALEVAEEARARAFLDLLATRDLLANRTAPSQLEARAERPGNNQGLGRAVLMRGGGSEKTALSDKLGADSELRSLASVQPFSLSEVQATARRLNSTILSYWVTQDTTYIWAVSPEGEIHTAEVRASWENLQQLISGIGPGVPAEASKNEAAPQELTPAHLPSAKPRQELRVTAHVSARGGTILTLGPSRRRKWRELYRLLIEPVEAWLPSAPGSMLTIEPHGPLLMLPFAALTDQQGRYLLERFSLHYTPAVSLLRFTEKKEEEAQRIPAHYLLVADPADMPRDPGQNALPGLPGSRREVAAVARLLPASEVTILEGRKAAEGRVANLAGYSTVIHFATHGIIRDDQPFDSYLALGVNPADPKEDGRLTAEKIYGMDLHADLVFLSACRSGQGKVSGDGLVGLTRAFWYAGTPSVIASLWDVADEPTYRLVAIFYRSRLEGNDKGRALRAAQLRLLHQLRAGTVTVHTSAGEVILPEDPIFWAGFVLQGEP